MEERDDARNNTHALMNDSGLSSTYFPAWGPAVTVAAAMLIFLAASFYIRHRKVVKKREILMDYFYIIFQYGGLRRKRMVAALCNTNAITLRELGRSFMISFDSIANSDNSCPFYLEDTNFGQGGPSMTPGASKKTFFRNRGMISAKKARGPFRRYNTQSDDSPSLNPVSLQDILMRFKTKRTATTSPNPGQSSGYRHGKLEGSSMCAIHGDDLEYQPYIEENEEPRYKRERRNAYVAHVDSPGPRFADIVTEVGRRSLGNVMPSGEAMRSSPYPGKRNSEPWHNLEGGCSCLEHHHDGAHHSRVFQLNSERLSPSNVVCGSHGYIPKLSQAGSLGGSCCSYRNSEPTILIHPASTDVDPTQGWTDIRNRYTNGIVFLKKVPKGDGTTGEFYYEEQREPSVDLARRASLSKVSYVPSGNMNDYYNCLSSPKKTTPDPPIGMAAATSTKSPARKSNNLEPGKCKRSRLSLGEIAVSNFNRRIEIVSESFHESSAHESSLESRGSQDSAANQQHSKYKSTWLKFKNVFTGSRSTTHSSKSSKSASLIDDRQRRRSDRRQDSRWKRFFSVLTGFRSLPETKVTSRSLDCPKCSVSVPSGLDYHTKCHSIDIESGLGLLDLTMSRTSLHDDKCNECSDSVTSVRPRSLKLPSQTRSVPEELSKLRHQYQQLKNTPELKRPSQEISALISRRYRKRLDPKEASSLSLPLCRKDFGSCSAKSGMTFTLDPANKLQDKEHNNATCLSNSGKSFQQGNGSVDKLYFTRRFRNLSPLPETCIGGSCKNDALCPYSDGDNISERSIYLTPSHFITEKHFDYGNGFNFSLLGNDDIRKHYCSKSSECLNKLGKSSTNLSNVRKVSSDTSLVHVTKNQLTNSGFNTRVTVSSEYSNSNFYSSVNIASDKQILLLPKTSQSDFSSSNLNLEQRQLGLSNETVYFDSISALGTPGAMSPLEPRKMLGVAASPPMGAVTPQDSESITYFESNLQINSQENVSICSEIISHSPNPSQLSSPFVSRSPSPCQFWPNSSHPFSYVNFSQLAIPTPTRSAVTCSLLADKSQPRSDTSKVSLSGINVSTPSVLTSNNPQTEDKDPKQLTSGDVFQSEKYSDKNFSSNFTSVLGTKTKDCGSSKDIGQINSSSSKDIGQINSSSSKDIGHVNSSDCKGVRAECELLCDLDDKQLNHQPSPGGSRNPTPTRSFSTPSPTFEKSVSHQSASPDEIYRANVSRLPRFARRASQGTAVPYLQHQDLITARMANERNPPLRESSTETSQSHTDNHMCRGDLAST